MEHNLIIFISLSRAFWTCNPQVVRKTIDIILSVLVRHPFKWFHRNLNLLKSYVIVQCNGTEICCHKMRRRLDSKKYSQ